MTTIPHTAEHYQEAARERAGELVTAFVKVVLVPARKRGYLPRTRRDAEHR